MLSAWLHRDRMRYRIAIIYTLLAALIASLCVTPAQVKGAGSAFTDFRVTTENTAYYSGYWLGGGNYTKETPAYHFNVTSADGLQAGDTIQIVLPYQYNFVGNPNLFGMWTTGVSLPSNSFDAMLNGSTLSLFDSVTTQVSDDWHPALSFHLSQPVPASGIVDMKVTNFLITPDYHYRTPGAEQFAVSTGANPVQQTAANNIYFRSVVDFRPDSSTYAAGANSAYQFKFTVMQQITSADTITLKFPAGITLPGIIDISKVQIGGVSVASATVNGDMLQLRPSQLLPSYSTALITIDASALIANPAASGYYTFEIATSVDPQTATGRYGIIPAGGASLADNPSSNKGYVEINYDGRLRFRFTGPVILKGGDTVTVTSPAGTVLSDTAISPGDIHIDSGTGQELSDYTPASVTRIADNQLQFVLPPAYYLIPDYGLTFSLPNLFVDYGAYDMQVTTSQTIKPATVTLLIAPDTVEQFTVTPGNPWAGETNVPYTFSLKPNEPLDAASDDSVTLNLPPQLKVPVVLDPNTLSGTIDPSLVLVNGVPAKEATYFNFMGMSRLRVTVPQNIPLLGTMVIAVSGNAGWTNPAEGTYAFSVYPNWNDFSSATGSVMFTQITGISAAPQTVQLKLGNTVSQQLKVTAQRPDNSVLDVTDAVYGTAYRSSNSTVATVTTGGLIEAKQSGTAVITVTSGSFTDTVNVTVAKADVPPPVDVITGITAAPRDVQLKLGASVSQQLKVTAQLSNSSVKDVTGAVYGTTYRSSDSTVATVTTGGLIEAKQPGTAEITVTNGSFKDTVNVTVVKADVPPPVVKVTGITAAPRTVQLQLGAAISQQLTVTAQLSSNSVKDVTGAVYGTAYLSSDSTVATVTAGGLIEAKQAGSAVITVTNSVYSDTVQVTVYPSYSGGHKHSGGSSTAPSSSTGSGSTGTGAAEEPLSVEKEIFAAPGGTVELPNVGSVVIPPAALPSDGKVKVAVQVDQTPAIAGRAMISRVVDFTSSTGANVNKPIQISLKYNGASIPSGSKPAVYVYNRTQDKWLYVGGIVAGNGTVTAEVNYWGTFAVFAAEQHVFSDMNGHWAAPYVDRLAGRDIIHGFEDHTFRPDQSVTRAQLVKMIADALALKSAGAQASFADRDALPDWAKDAVAQAVQEGVIQGYQEKGSTWFKPNQPLTRAELAVILSRVLDRYAVHGGKQAAAFTDQKDIPDWAQPAVKAVSGESIVSGYPDGSFRPGGYVTRAEAAKMIYMLLESLQI